MTTASGPGRNLAPVARLVISVVLLSLVISITPIEEFLATVSTLSLMAVALVMGLLVASMYIGAHLLRRLLRGQALQVSASRIFRLNLIALFYSFVLPLGSLAGGVVRWYRLGAPTRSLPEVLAAILFSRLTEVFVLASLALAFWLAEPETPGGQTLGVTLAAFFVTTVTAYIAASMQRSVAYLRRIWVWMFKMWRGLRPLGLKLSRSLRRLGTIPASDHLVILGLGVARNLIEAVALFVLAVELNIDVAFTTIVWVQAVVDLLAMLPISVAGLGVREAGLVVLLQPFGIGPAGALSLSLSLVACSVLLAMVGGALEFAHWRRGPEADSSDLADNSAGTDETTVR